jgi:hypothetical protein
MNDETNAVGTRLNASTSEGQSGAAFRAYLQHFGLSILDVALAAQLRLSTVWNIEHGIPIREEHAQAVRSGLYRLTGREYSAPIPAIPSEILQMTQGSQPTRLPRLKRF